MASRIKQTKILFQAAADGQLDVMKSAIELRANPNFKTNLFSKLYSIDLNGRNLQKHSIFGDNPNNLLHIAVLSDSISILDYVIQDLGVKECLNIPDQYGFTPIAIASRNNKPNAVKHLIEQYGVDPKQHNISVQMSDDVGEIIHKLSLASLALYGQNEELASYLFTLDPEVVCDVAMTHLKLGHVEQFQSLLLNNDNVLQQIRTTDITALKSAVESGSIEMVKYMVSIINMDQISNSTNLPHYILEFAITRSLFDIVHYLIQDLHFTFHSIEKIPFDRISIPTDLFDLILQSGLQTRPENEELEQFIFKVASYGDIILVKHLIQHYNINPIQPKFNLFKSFIQSGKCTIEIVDYIASLGVIIDEKWNDSIIFAAISNCDTMDIIQRLIHYGADINTCMKKDREILCALCQSKHVNHDIFKYFLNPNFFSSGDLHKMVEKLAIIVICTNELDTFKHFHTNYSIPMNLNLLFMFLNVDIGRNNNQLIRYTLNHASLDTQDIGVIFGEILSNKSIDEETIIQFFEMYDIDPIKQRTANGLPLLHQIAATTQSTQVLDIIMNLTHGINITECQDDNYETFLFKALPRINTSEPILLPAPELSSLKFIQHVLSKYGSTLHLNYTSRYGYTIYECATQFEDTTLLESLFKADVSSTAHLHDIFRFALRRFKNKSVIKLLLQHKVGFSLSSDDYLAVELVNNPIYDCDSIKKLALLNEINRGISPNELIRFIIQQAGPKEHRLELCQLLLQHKASPTKIFQSQSLLHYAVRKDDYNLVSLLIQQKAPINLLNQFQQSPLTVAFDAGAYDVIKLLISSNANVNTLSIGGFSERGDLYKFVDTPLHTVIKRELDNELRNDLIQHIINHKGNINAVNVYHQTPLMASMRFRRFDVTNYLLEQYGNIIDFSIPDGNGQISLHQAAIQPSEELFLSVLHHDFHVCNQIDYYGNTPLLHAAQHGWNDHISVLVNHGADPTICNSNGFTTMHYLSLFSPYDDDTDDDDDDEEDDDDDDDDIDHVTDDGSDEDEEAMAKKAQDENFRSILFEDFIDVCISFILTDGHHSCSRQCSQVDENHIVDQ